MKWRVFGTLLWILCVHALFYLAEQHYHATCIGTGYSGFLLSLYSHWDTRCSILRMVSHHAHSRVIASIASVLPLFPLIFKGTHSKAQDCTEPIGVKRRRVVVRPDSTREFKRHLIRRIGVSVEDKVALLA